MPFCRDTSIAMHTMWQTYLEGCTRLVLVSELFTDSSSEPSLFCPASSCMSLLSSALDFPSVPTYKRAEDLKVSKVLLNYFFFFFG